MGSLKIGHLILIFALAALPFCAAFALYYPDERHYTDGALQMIKGAGWLIPHTAAGLPRLEKPPLAYWSTAACYKILGVSVLASRLSFLLAACATIYLTFRLARKLTRDNKTALLAAVVLASQPQFFLSATRSIPDALLVFFVTLSAFGFLRLIVFEEFAAGAFWMAYGGAAGAALSKGLLGFLIVAFAWGFCGLMNRDWRAIRKLIHWPIFLITLVFGTGWFVYIFCKAPELAWRQFFGDQVTGNMHGHFWTPIFRVPLFALILLFNFLPWSATTLEFLARRKLLETGAVPVKAKNFILWWTLVLILGFSLGANISLRYLLPATPLVAVLFADVLVRIKEFPLVISVQCLLQIALALLAVGAITAFYVDSQWPQPIILPVAVGVLVLAGVVVLRFSTVRNKLTAAEALGFSILTMWILFFYAAMPILFPDRAQQIAKTLRQSGADAQHPVLLVGDVKLASRLRVVLGKDWTVMQMNRLAPQAKFFDRVIISGADVGKFVGRGWTVIPAASSVDALPPRELLLATLSRQLPKTLARHSDSLWLAAHQ